MGDLWRSEKMELVQLFIHSEAAHDTFDELGQRGLVDFRDVLCFEARLSHCSVESSRERLSETLRGRGEEGR